MLIVWGLLAITVLTVATGYFVAQEFAYLAVDRGRLRQHAEDGDKAAERAYRVAGRLSFMLSGAQFGITVTALLAGYVAEPLLGEGLAAVLGSAGVPEAVSLSVSVVLALGFATVVQMVLGELFPKNLAIAEPERLARALSRSTLAYLAVAGPLIRLFDASANKLLRMVGIEPVEELPQGVTPEDLQRIIDDSEAGGLLDPELSRLLDRGLDFRALTAGQAMTPRVAVHTVRADDPAAEVVRMIDTGHSRFPVVGSDVDDLVGVVGLAEVLAVEPGRREATRVREIAGPALLVPDSLPLPAVLERLRAERRQLAVVLDEFGGFAGVISLEDLAEELVGEIHDEDDGVEPAIVREPDGSWVVAGRMRIDEIADATGLPLSGDDVYETVSGLVLHELGRVTHVGDTVRVELPAVLGESDEDEPRPGRVVLIEVTAVSRHVPQTVRLSVADAAEVER
ncbi:MULTISPECIES: hemolysin family protein [Actinokineospora]|uniref:Membrane protein n=1 Tax=Actinokineospora fastidiosa TaxID=1816 RepID=A0A918GMC9_9PSEU|nr:MULTISPECIES: hemolysin family protein [Actinokineospora]UVS78521.1 Magnesium and cobalt efflux protein CorC [Actinokineospora sp. UTMC 2448]GGS45104.1 membrane protein [Actinokineospora fastidiosa]